MSRRRQGFFKITVAAYLGHDFVLQKLLIQQAPDTSSQGDHGRTPLWWASHNGHGNTVRLLSGKVADASYTAEDVYESIHIAVQQGHTATFSVFLEQSLCKAHSLHGA